MKIGYILLLFVCINVLNACQYKTFEDPVDTSHAVPSGQISLGGIVAEQLLNNRLFDTIPVKPTSFLIEKINRMRRSAEELKMNNKSAEREQFNQDWLELQKKISCNIENLSNDDIQAWVVLNDSLLKYKGEVRYADKLEEMVYSGSVPEAISENMIKSFYYSRLYDRIYVNMFGSSAIEYEHTTGGKVRILQDTEYPFDGSITIKFELQDSRFLDLFIRIPEWAEHASVTVKGVKYNVVAGKYSEIARQWKNGDEVEIILDILPEIIENELNTFAFKYGSLFLSYLKEPDNQLAFSDSNPLDYLRYVSSYGKMPTFVFNGIPDQTLVLQPYFAETQVGEKRTAWIQSTH